ncbi:MAG TPA: hypothetical protein VHL53_19820 [Acidimicrobiia bacterium]|nr:hypothetical protein [Acidimicrobiia bacterium]
MPEPRYPEFQDLPSTPPTPASGPAIDPSSTAVPFEPRPTAPAPPSTTPSAWFPEFVVPLSAPAGAGSGDAAAGRRRAGRDKKTNRTRAVVAGTSVAAFLVALAAVGLHGGPPASAPATVRTGDDGPAATLDPGLIQPRGSGTLGGTIGSSPSSPFSGRFGGGGFSATPGSGSGGPNTRSHGS